MRLRTALPLHVRARWAKQCRPGQTSPVTSHEDRTRGQHMAGTVEKTLAAQGIVLHTPPSPVANYVGFVRTGNLLVISGQVCFDAEGKLIAKGKLGAGVTIEQGAGEARGCAITPLAQRRATSTGWSAWSGAATLSFPRLTSSTGQKCSTALPT